MNTFVLKPRRGLTVLRPDTLTALSAAGESVPRTSYWLHRLADGDVVRLDADAAPARGKE